MAKPLRLPGIEEQELLDGLQIELVLEPGQRERWNQLVIEQHYLHNATLVGEQLRYVVSYQQQWLALLGWSAPAWHLRLREEWLGWSEPQRCGRLHFIAQNSRFLILADRGRYPNLGTRAMKLCVERLSQDWQQQHGHSTFGPGKLCGWATVSWHDLQSGQLDVAGSHGRLRACGGGFLCGP